MALEVFSDIFVDMNRPYISTISAKQYDNNSRKIRVHLLENGVEWTPPSGLYSMIQFLKNDRNGGFYDTDENGESAISINGSIATLIFAAQVLTTPGEVKMELCFIDQNGIRLTSFQWIVNVIESALADQVISSTYVSVLDRKITEASRIVANFAGVTASAATVAYTSEADVDVSGGEDAPYHFTFKVPRGMPGATGPQGPAGHDGKGAVDTVDSLEPTGGDVNLGCVSYSRDQTLSEANRNKFLKNLGTFISKNIILIPQNWIPDNTYKDFGYTYRYPVGVVGCTDQHIPEVYFSVEDSLSGNFAPFSVSANNSVYVYASQKPSSTVTIPYILVHY